MKVESFPRSDGKNEKDKKTVLEKIRSFPVSPAQAVVGLTALAAGGSAFKEMVQQNIENESKKIKTENIFSPNNDLLNYKKTVNYQDVIDTRSDFSSNQMSKVGLAYAEYEAQFALGDFSEMPYGNLFDLYRYYFGQPLESNILTFSKYQPVNSKDSTIQYIAINDSGFLQDVLKEYYLHKNELPIGETIQVSGYEKFKIPKNKTTSAIGGFFLGHGKDDKGEYISYYDVFDAGTGTDPNALNTMQGAKGFEIYDRIYIDADGNPVQE